MLTLLTTVVWGRGRNRTPTVRLRTLIAVPATKDGAGAEARAYGCPGFLARSGPRRSDADEGVRALRRAAHGTMLACLTPKVTADKDVFMSQVYLTDLRQAARSLARAPGFTTVAVLTLGVGLGLATAIYAALKEVVINPLPYPDADGLMVLLSEVPGSGTDDAWGASTAQYFHFRDNAELLDDIGVMRGVFPVSISRVGDQSKTRVGMAGATAGIHRMLDARAIVGRALANSDDQSGGAIVAILSEAFWRTHFGGDPDIVGQTVLADFGSDAAVVEIVGVVSVPGEYAKADVWLPLQLDPAGPHYNQHDLFLLAKRKPGVSLEAAQTEIDGLTDQLAEVYPGVYGTFEIQGEKVGFMERFGFRSRWNPLKDYLVGASAAPLWIAQGAIVLLLVVAWVAIINLFLARVETQRPQIAVRTALGAGRGAVVRQLAWASTLIVIGAWLVGTGLAWWLAAMWVAVDPIDLPGADDVGIDGGVLSAAAAVALLVAVSMVAASMWRLRGVSSHLNDAGRGSTSSLSRQRTRGLLVVTQVALALVLLVGAGLLVSSFRNLVGTDPGVEPYGVVKLRLNPDSGVGSHWWPQLRELQGTVATLPGVSAVGASESLPFERGYFGCVAQHFEDPAVAEHLGTANLTACGVQDFVTPGYFAAAGIPLLQGRPLAVADFDGPSTRGAVVSRSFAAKFFPGESPIGKRLAPYGWDWFTIVGVVGDVYATSVADPPTPHVYYPLARIPPEAGWDPLSVALVVRTELSEPAGLLPTLRRVVATRAPDVAIADADTLSAIVERSMSQDRFMAALLGFAAAAALVLAIVGMYGVVSYLITRRTNEIGVRVAVGALPAAVRRMMVVDSLKLVAIGLVIGLAVSLNLAAALRGLLFGVTPTSPAVYAACVLVLTSAAALASWCAAGRAARMTPMDALRVE